MERLSAQQETAVALAVELIEDGQSRDRVRARVYADFAPWIEPVEVDALLDEAWNIVIDRRTMPPGEYHSSWTGARNGAA